MYIPILMVHVNMVCLLTIMSIPLLSISEPYITRQSAQWGMYTPRPALPPLLKEHKVFSFDSGDGSCMLYVITWKEFNDT